MKREELQRFIKEPDFRDNFLSAIKTEVALYRECLKKGGTSCHVNIVGEAEFGVNFNELSEITNYISKNYDNAFVDYILTAIQLDEKIKKDSRVEEFLDSQL